MAKINKVTMLLFSLQAAGSISDNVPRVAEVPEGHFGEGRKAEARYALLYDVCFSNQVNPKARRTLDISSGVN